jgi:hypothetical protein
MESSCRILSDEELEKQPQLKKSDMREWKAELLTNQRPFDAGFIKASFPRAFYTKNYTDEFPSLPRSVSTVTITTVASGVETKPLVSLLEKVKSVLAVPLDRGEQAAPPIELHEPKTPPYY